MNLARLFLLVVAGCWLLHPAPLLGDDIASPLAANKQFSADMVVTTNEGETITQKIYSDNGNVRTEITIHSMQMTIIVRPDRQKAYNVMPSQKMVMEMPYNPDKIKKIQMATTGPEGKVELIGPDTVNDEACTKYKVTGDTDGKVFYIWVDATTKAPVRMTAEDGSMTILWKNYKAGPQDAALFEPPSDYQKMAMPSMPGSAPGNAPGGGQ